MKTLRVGDILWNLEIMTHLGADGMELILKDHHGGLNRLGTFKSQWHKTNFLTRVGRYMNDNNRKPYETSAWLL